MITTLPNGLRVCTRPMSGVETATVGLFADCGSRHETETLNGIAHLFEHMVFKGAGPRSAREISEAIEDVGGDLNACTDRDGTSFTASVMAEHVSLAIELLGDLIGRPHLTADDLQREKQVVLQELAEAEDTPSDIIFDELWSAAFPDQALGRSILGSAASIEAITPADLNDWRDTHYRGGNLILVTAGKVDHREVAELAEIHLGGLASGDVPPSQSAHFAGGARVGRTPSDQAHLTFGFPAPTITAADYYPARLFADIVGSGASSRLFQEVRETHGLAYSVSGSLQPYDDIGIFYIHAATSRKDAIAAGQLIEEELGRAVLDISERELQRAKTQARAGMLMALESSWGQANFAARQIATFGRIKEPSEIVAELEAVTLDQIRAAGAAMLAGPTARATLGMPRLRAA